jgi:hypothetical protein
MSYLEATVKYQHIALHPRFAKMRNRRERWRAIRALKRQGVKLFIKPVIRIA